GDRSGSFSLRPLVVERTRGRRRRRGGRRVAAPVARAARAPGLPRGGLPAADLDADVAVAERRHRLEPALLLLPLADDLPPPAAREAARRDRDADRGVRPGGRLRSRPGRRSPRVGAAPPRARGPRRRPPRAP